MLDGAIVSFSVAEMSVPLVTALRAYSVEDGNVTSLLKELSVSEELLNLPYQSVKVGITGKLCTLVPEEFAAPSGLFRFLDFNHTAGEPYHYDSSRISGIPGRMVFAAKKSLVSLVQGQFPKAALYHGSVPLLETILNENRAQAEEKFFIHSHGQLMDIVAVVKGKLAFFNVFEHREPEDFLYYILFVFEQLGLAPGEQEVTLLGDLHADSGRCLLLMKYFGRVRFGNRPSALRFGPGAEAYPAHRYFNTYSLHLCE